MLSLFILAGIGKNSLAKKKEPTTMSFHYNSEDEENKKEQEEANRISEEIGEWLKEEAAKEEQPDWPQKPNVEKYYNSIGEIQKRYSIKETKNILSEKEAVAFLKKRGFKGEVTTNYSINGEYIDGKIINNKDNVIKHPMYNTSWTDILSEEYWNVTIVDGEIFAFPFYTTLKTDVTFIVSESDTFLGYDSGEGFCKIKPYNDSLVLVTVDKINTDTLKKIDARKIAEEFLENTEE